MGYTVLPTGSWGPESSQLGEAWARTLALRSGPGLWGGGDERSGLPEEECMILTSSDFGKSSLFGKAWLSELRAASWRGKPALACVGLLFLGVQLAFGQVGEADADGGQGLRVVRLHDVAQEPHPKFLGAGRKGVLGSACDTVPAGLLHPASSISSLTSPPSNPRSPREAHWAYNLAVLANCDDQFLCVNLASERTQLFNQALI